MVRASALLLLVMLAGCETLTEATPPPETPTPTPVLTAISGPGYTTMIPPGWESRLNDQDELHRFSAGGQPILLLERRPQGPVEVGINDVPSSIAVVRLRDRIPDEKVVGYLKNFPGTTLQQPPAHYALGEDEGVVVVYTRSLGGTPVETMDIVVNHHQVTHEAFFNAIPQLFSDRVSDMTTLMDSWSWADGP